MTSPSRSLLQRLTRPSAALGLVAGLVLATGAAAVAATTAESQAMTIASIENHAQDALGDARAAVAAASAVTADISASGLDIGVADTTIDTTTLREAMAQLTDLDIMPTFLMTDAADTAALETERVAARTSVLRTALDEALAAKKAADEAAAAAEQARLEAEAAAAALAAANTVEGAQATAQRIAADQYGWGAGEFSCLVSLWNRESGWNYEAYNSSSGATGIPQSLPGSKMASAGADWQTNATTQIAWGLDYISRGYGSPCGAWGHSEATGWY